MLTNVNYLFNDGKFTSEMEDIMPKIQKRLRFNIWLSAILHIAPTTLEGEQP
jgi:hypothetical protein